MYSTGHMGNSLRTVVMSKYMQLKTAVRYFMLGLQLTNSNINGNCHIRKQNTHMHTHTHIYLTHDVGLNM